MKNLFFIHRFPFNKEAFIRDEFEYFISKGFNVKYLDISNLLKKKDLGVVCPDNLKKHVIEFTTKSSFKNFLINHNTDSLIITDVGLLSNSAWMYLGIFKAKVPYVLFENAVLPKIKNKSKKPSSTGLIKAIKRFNYKKIVNKPIEVINHISAKSLLYPSELIITSKPKLSAEKRSLKTKDTEIKYSMSMDYKVAMDTNNSSVIDEPYAVFVDQYFIHHPDFKTNHIAHFFTADEYYGELNRFLKKFSKKSGLKIVIASHPRRNELETKDFSEEFDIYYNQTAQLIKNSKAVLIHFSTAINFAVIFNKPFLLLDSEIFKNSSVKSEIEMFSSFFNKKTVDMKLLNENYDLNSLLSVNNKKYEEYFNNYIKHPKATDESFRDLIEYVLDKMK